MKMDKKLSDVELLERAVKLLLSNINLALIIFLCSLPLFCFLIFFELSLQTTLSFTYQFLSKQVNVEKGLQENDLFLETNNYLTYQSVYQQRNIWEDLSENDLIPWMIKTSLLYFFPFTILDLLTTTMIVAASSTVYMSKEEPLGLLDLVHRCIKICQKRLGGCLITSLYVLLLSTSVFLFFLPFFLLFFFGVFSHWAEKLNFVNFVRGRQSFVDQIVPFLIYATVVLVQATLFIYLTAKFIKWSAGWNMSLVVSVLEEDGEDGEEGIYGSDALSLSAWYRKGHENRDVWMMLVFLVFAVATRTPCLYSKCSLNTSGNGVLCTGVYVCLICVGNVVKWLACVVRYHDCKSKTRPSKKKADVEQAKPAAT